MYTRYAQVPELLLQVMPTSQEKYPQVSTTLEMTFFLISYAFGKMNCLSLSNLAVLLTAVSVSGAVFLLAKLHRTFRGVCRRQRAPCARVVPCSVTR
jgi:hypothetical protein